MVRLRERAKEAMMAQMPETPTLAPEASAAKLAHPLIGTMVEGHVISEEEAVAFDLFCIHKYGSDVIRIMHENGYQAGTSTVYAWRKRPWWIKLEEDVLEHERKRFEQKMADRTDDIFNAYMDVVKGEDKADKTASARIRGVELYMTAGKKPIINKSPQVVLNQNNQYNTVNVTMDELRGMTTEQQIEYCRTGRLPEAPIDVTPPKELPAE